MINKILIVDSNEKERSQLEKILQEVIQKGGEIIIAEKREDGLAIIERDHPQLVFLDARILGDKKEWELKGVHIVVMRGKNEEQLPDEDSILKPFKAQQVLEKCHAFLSNEPPAFIPLM